MTPKGFWSYARGDDAALDADLSRLRGKVAEEVSLLLGAEVDMFQDIYDIRHGDDWEARLRDELTGASFMIPVLTPRYFKRPWCREEVMTYLRLASERGVPARLYPIYVVTDRKYDRGEHCEVRAAVARYQHFDWRPLRFEESEKKLGKAINDFAESIHDKLDEDTPDLPLGTAAAPPVRPAAAKPTPANQPEKTTPAKPPPAGKEHVVEEHVVDQWPGRGDFRSISDATDAAQPGARIVIRPGTYQENLVLDKVLELVGEGEPGAVEVRVSKGHILKVTAPLGLLRNIRFLRGTGGGHDVALSVTAGHCQFEDCSFTSRSFSGVAVKGAGTAPEFRRCRFEGSARGGAFVQQEATPRFDTCRFSENAIHGITIISGADPHLRNCVLKGNTASGAFVWDSGRGRFEDCDFSGNGLDGVASQEEGQPVLHGCRLTDNSYAGFHT